MVTTNTSNYALYLLRAANGLNPYTNTGLGGNLTGGLSGNLTAAYTGYSFPTDSRGRVVLPTMATMEQATTPEDKLAVAGQLADFVQIQAEAATRTSLPNRVADMTAECKKVLDAVGAVVDGLKTADGSLAAGETDPALEPYEKALSRVLGTLRSTLAKVSGLLSKADKEIAAATDKEIQRLDVTGRGLASLAGLEWEPLPSIATGSAFQPDPTKLVDILV